MLRKSWGYVPILHVQKIRTSVEYLFYISAKSLIEPLEELLKSSDLFKEIKLRIRKESGDPMAKYKIGGLE